MALFVYAEQGLCNGPVSARLSVRLHIPLQQQAHE